MSERTELTLFVVLALVAAAAWWASYVRPNDRLAHATMACVHERGSFVGDRQTFNECYGELVVKAGGLVPFFHAPRGR